VRDEIEPGHKCKTLLMQVGRRGIGHPPRFGMEKMWEGRRRGDDTEPISCFAARHTATIMKFVDEASIEASR